MELCTNGVGRLARLLTCGDEAGGNGTVMISGCTISAKLDSFLCAHEIAASKVLGSFQDTISCMGGIKLLMKVLNTNASMLATVMAELVGVRLVVRPDLEAFVNFSRYGNILPSTS